MLALVTLTLASPFIPLPGDLPAVRVEQVLLVLLILPLAVFLARHPEHRSLGLIDVGFLALAVSTAATILLVPFFVPGSTRSLRDLFEIAWLAQLWLVYRLARIAANPGDLEQRVVRLLAWASVVLGGFAVLQYLNPPGFNDTVTAFWTQAHNLLGVEREGRAVGSSGNANQFGMLETLLLCAALAGLIGGMPNLDRRLAWSAIVAASVGLVLSQSRGAFIATGVALLAGLALSMSRHRFRAALRNGIPPVLVGGVIALALSVAAPPQSGGVLGRFDPTTFLRDPSVIIRLGRAQAVLGTNQNPPPNAADPGLCVNGLLPAAPAPGHEPGGGAPQVPSQAAQSSVRQLAAAVATYYCRNGSWPQDPETDLVPSEIAAIPSDPSTGQPLTEYSSDRGYMVGEPVRPPSGSLQTPESLGIGSLPNLLQNPSFESGAAIPTGWLVTPGTSITRSGAPGAAFSAAFGQAAIAPGGGVYELVTADFPTSTQYVAGVWLKSPSASVVLTQLYVVAIRTDGTRVDPLASTTLTIPGDGHWHHALLPLQTPVQRLTALQVMVRAPQRPIAVDLDGASLTEGPLAPAFGSLVEGTTAAPGDAVLEESPILGLGPQKDARGAAFDNEYLSFLAHYGLLGLGAYLFLFLCVLIQGVRGARRDRGWSGMLAAALVASVVGLLAFAISAGAYRQLQTMVILWVIAGLVVAASLGRTGEVRTVSHGLAEPPAPD